METRSTRGVGQATYEAVLARVRDGESVQRAARAVAVERGIAAASVSSTFYRYAQHDPESPVEHRPARPSTMRIAAAFSESVTDPNGVELRPLDVVAALSVLERYIERLEAENRTLRKQVKAAKRATAKATADTAAVTIE